MSVAGLNKHPEEILGVSHLVLAVHDLEAPESFLHGHGYSKYGEVRLLPNPVAKAPFVFETLASSFSMKLLISKARRPPIELLSENQSGTNGSFHGESCFEAVLGENGDKGVDAVLNAVERGFPASIKGFRVLGACARSAGVAGLIIYSRDLALTLSLWNLLGFREEVVCPGVLRLKIPGFVGGSSELPVYFSEDPSKPEGSYLDGSGIVCLSFFCRDADRLRLRLKEAGYFVGDCFNLAPFQNPLRIFFARNVSGEIYEFLSVVRKRKESWKIPE